MKALITGSSGYLGRMLTDYLISKKIPVVGIDIRETNGIQSENFKFYNCSIEEKEKLNSIFLEENPTHILHFACSFNKIRDREKEYGIDINGSANILEVSNSTPSVQHLIFSSSAAAYGGNKDNKPWLIESESLRPGKYRYGLNKKLIENIFIKPSLRVDFRITTLRICTVIGPYYSKPKSIVSLLIRFPYLPSCCRENKLQFLHSDDMVTLFGHMLEDCNIEGVYNMAPNSYSVVGKLLPDKIFVNIPLPFIKATLWILWNLGILNLQPAAIKDAVYPIVIDPGLLASKYNYTFKYTSDEAFRETMKFNSLPIDARF